MRITVNTHTVEIIQGDITVQETDAIVNAANSHLWMGAGVAGAIKRNGGDGIEKEAIALGPVEIGTAVMTSGGNLRAKFVLHAAVMGQDLHTNAENIRAATRSSLQLAEHHQLTSISFPALGTGVGGFSPFHCAKLMITETVEFLQISRFLALVRFVLLDQSMCRAFEEELKLEFSRKRH